METSITYFLTGLHSFSSGNRLKNIYSIFKNDLPVGSTSTEQELYDFVEKIVPEYDRQKVYPSDLKKLVSWYKTISKFAPEILEQKTEIVGEK